MFRLDTPKPAAWPLPTDQEGNEVLLRYPREVDPVGHVAHTVLGALTVATVPVSPAAHTIAFLVLLAYSMARLWVTWRAYVPLLRSKLLYVLLLWPAWFALSLLWSPSVAQAQSELAAMRLIVLPWLLWPVMDQLPKLIGAFLFGVLVQNSRQLLDHLGLFGFVPAYADRSAGMLHPIQTGAVCVAAMCWTLSATLLGRGWGRWIALALTLIAGLGLFATASRGPWIAAIVVIPLCVIVTAWRRPSARPMALGLLAVAVLATAVGWPLAGRNIRDRVQSAVTEVQDAREDGVYWTSAGLRIGLWDWALQVYRQNPVRGVGAGGFAQAVSQLPDHEAAMALARDILDELPGYREAVAAGTDPTQVRGFGRAQRNIELRYDFLDRDHAHSVYLHTLASNGTVGGIILVAVLIVMVIFCVRSPHDHVFSEGNLFVLISWMIGGQFDAYHLGGNLLGLLMLVFAVTMPMRMRLRDKTAADAIENPSDVAPLPETPATGALS